MTVPGNDDKPEDEDIISGSGLVVSENGSGTTEENEYRRLNFEPEPKDGASALADIRPENGENKAFYISVSRGTQNANYYFKNTINYNASYGAVFYTTGNNVVGEGAVWYFEAVSAETNTYRVYTYLSGYPNEKKYILRNTSGTGNAIDLTADPAQAVVFEIRLRSEGLFYMKDSGAEKYFRYSNGGGGARFYNNTGDKGNDQNSRLTLTYADSLEMPDDHYGLDGKTYGIMYAGSSNGISIAACCNGRRTGFV